MKKIISLFLIIVLVGGVAVLFAGGEALAEEAKEKIETPIKDPHSIRGGGGPMLGVLNLDLGDLNEVLESNNFGKLDETLILAGGGGSGGFKIGSRFGGFGLGGSVSATEENNKATLGINYGGFLYEYGFKARGDFDAAWGLLLGGGKFRLDLISENPDNFESIVEDVNDNDSTSATLEKSFAFLQPRIGGHYQFAKFVGLEVNLGYFFTHDFGSEWEVAQRGVSGDPLGNSHGPTVDFKLSFGF